MIQVFDRQQVSIKRYRSKTLPISPLALRGNQFFHTFIVSWGRDDFSLPARSRFGEGRAVPSEALEQGIYLNCVQILLGIELDKNFPDHVMQMDNPFFLTDSIVVK
jgi:hypothetical protein